MALHRLMTFAFLLICTSASIGGRALPQDPALPDRLPDAASGAVPMDVTAERFSFTPSEIKTTVGTPLQIRLRSEDTDHGFKIAGTDINASIPKRGRGVVTVTFTPGKPGRYTFECSHVCGAGHSFMRGAIVVRDR